MLSEKTHQKYLSQVVDLKIFLYMAHMNADVHTANFEEKYFWIFQKDVMSPKCPPIY